jgi:lysophospholipase L1-like esterase
MRRSLATIGVLLLVGCATPPSASISQGAPASTSEATATETAGASPSASAAVGLDTSWVVVALGDSIAYNSPMVCPGCTGFVDQYAKRLEQEAGHAVAVRNLSTPMLDTQGLLDQLQNSESKRTAVARASVIIVGIGFNDVPWLVSDDPCDGAAPFDDLERIETAAAKYTEQCVSATAELLRPKLEAVYSQLVDLSAGRPAIFLALNRYNDAIGWCEHQSCPWGSTTPSSFVAAAHLTVDAWDRVICETAEKHGFACVDVYHAFNGPEGTEPAGDMLAADYTHPSQLGNNRIADLLADEGYSPLVP